MQIHQYAEDYLETILMLNQRMGRVRSIDVVNELGYTKASVSIDMQLKKGNTLVYEGLEFDMDALRELGCEYLFSGAEIGDAERMGLELVGYYETDDSYWGIWVYCIMKEAK